MGISRQGVSQIAAEMKIDLSNHTGDRKRQVLIASGLLGKMPDTRIAEMYDVSEATVGKARDVLKIPKYVEPLEKAITNCRECKDNPYSRGMCKRHYAKYLYWQSKQ